MISHVVILLGFITVGTRSNLSQNFSIIFNVDCTFMIIQIVVLSSFNNRAHLVQSITKAQFRFQHRPYLYNRSSHCPIWFLSETTLGLIDYNNPVSFLVQTTPLRSIISLSYLVFITNRTWSNRPRQLNFIFGIDVPILPIMSLHYFV